MGPQILTVTPPEALRDPVVLGLDVSLTGTGIAGVDAELGGWSLTLGEKGRAGASWPDRVARLDAAVAAIVGAVTGHVRAPDLVVIEGPAYGSDTGHVWDRAGLWHRLVSEMTIRAWPWAVLEPSKRARWVTGRGNAGKSAIVEAMTRRYGEVWSTFHGSDDEADAAALCAAGLWHLGKPLAGAPQSHVDALTGVDWPEVPRHPLALAVAE